MALLRVSAATLLVWVSLFGGLVGAAPLLHAQSPPVSPSDSSESSGAEKSKAAQTHYRKAAKAFRAGDNESAVHHFRRAYELKPDGMLLYNLAIVHAAAGRPERAIWYAEQARKSGDLTRNARTRNAGRLRALRVAVDGTELADAFARQETETAKADDPAPPPPESRRPVEPPPTSQDASFDHPILWGGVSLAALGLGGLGGAAGLEISLQDDLARYRDVARTGDSGRYRDLRERIGRRQRLGRTLLIGGAISTGVGLALAAIDLGMSDGSPLFRLGAAGAPTSPDSLMLTLTVGR